jgi:hypothetical protein
LPKLPGINHLDAVGTLEKVGFRVLRQDNHIVISDGIHTIAIPRHNPVNAFTMAGIVRAAELTPEEFKQL